MMGRGVVLLTMARSRSSMTAEIFRRHGVFFGETSGMGCKSVGYNENLQLKRLARKWRPELYGDLLKGGDGKPRVSGFPQIWHDVLSSEGWDGQVWGAKVDAFCDGLFDGLEHIQIGIWRNPDDIVSSALRKLRRFSPSEWHRIVAKHHDRLRRLGIPLINTDELIEGNHDSLAKAFDVTGLRYDRGIAESVIGAV